jgi:type IV pilus assembly protein PilW
MMHKHQKGFTLIELMVGMVLSLLLISIVGGVFMSSRENHDVQDEVAQLQENIRIASALIRRVTFHSGHRTQPTTMAASAVQVVDLALKGQNGTAITSGSQDWFEVAFQGDGIPNTPSGVISDCLGNSVGVGTVNDKAKNPDPSRNRFQVQDFAGRPWLACSLDSGVTWQQLVPDVEAMEVEYGADFDDNGQVDSFSNADAVADWPRINTLRINLIFRTNRTIANGPDTNTYTLSDQTYGPFTDKRIRRNLVITASIRNRLSQ